MIGTSAAAPYDWENHLIGQVLEQVEAERNSDWQQLSRCDELTLITAIQAQQSLETA